VFLGAFLRDGLRELLVVLGTTSQLLREDLWVYFVRSV
jgi:hypothetical protein